MIRITTKTYNPAYIMNSIRLVSIMYRGGWTNPNPNPKHRWVIHGDDVITCKGETESVINETECFFKSVVVQCE